MMNNQYMKKLDVDKLVEITLPHLIKAGKVEENLSEEKMAWVKKLVALFQEKMSFGAEIVELTDMFFTEELMIEDEAKEVLAEEEVPEVLSAFLNEIDQLETFEADAIKASMKSVQKATGHKGKKLFMPIRSATTGQTHGPDLPQAIELLGKDKIKDRLASILG